MLRETNKQDEKGFAALIIAITLVIVTSLLVVGFAQLARNEQNQVTNRQLSNQAYYAAETGVNDATAALKAGYTAAKPACGPLTSSAAPGASYLTNNNVDQTSPATPGPTQWSCLLIDPAPPTVEYGSVSTTTPTLFTFSGAKLVGGAYVSTPVTSLTISWQDADGATNYRSDNGATMSSFPVASGPTGWNSVGMLRISLTPIVSGSLDRDMMRANTFTAFLYPTTDIHSTRASFNVSPTGNGPIINGGCSPTGTPRACTATITGIPAATFGSGPFLVSLRSIYSKTSVSIAINGASGDRLLGAQTRIDSTGRAQNVLKRIQVRVPAQNEYTSPGFDVETTGSLCKQLSVYPGFASDTCDSVNYP